MTSLSDPWFWAFVSMLGLQGATAIFSGHPIGRRLAFVTAALVAVTVGRVVLVLPMCPQPRFDGGAWSTAVGALILVAAAVVAAPALSIAWWRPPRGDMALRTSGVHGLIRHPLYLAEVLWFLGWAVAWRSTIGVALAPVWWAGFLVHALAEEAHLERTLGDRYAAYMARVRGRFLPGLPI